jgi:CIC family chloride channel protein
MSTIETTAQSKSAAEAPVLPEHATTETMPSVEPLQMSQIDMLKIAPTRDERLFLVLSIFIGIISGLLVVSFRVAISWVQALTIGSAPQPGLLRLIFVPVVMGAVVAGLVQWFFPAARGSGVNQTKAALYIYNGYISFKTVIGKFITSALALGGGF